MFKKRVNRKLKLLKEALIEIENKNGKKTILISQFVSKKKEYYIVQDNKYILNKSKKRECSDIFYENVVALCYV